MKVSPSREKILELFDEGFVARDELVVNLVNWLSESDAKEFFNQYYEEDEEDNDEQERWYDTSYELL